MIPDQKSKKKHPYAAIWGGYGGGNVGDYLTLAIALEDVTAQKKLDVKILNMEGNETAEQFPGLEVTTILNPDKSEFEEKLKYRIHYTLLSMVCSLAPILPKPFAKAILSLFGFIPWVRVLVNSDLLYFVGGGYINDLFDTKKPILTLKIANMCGIPVETAPLGIGPFRSEQIKQQFGQCFSKAYLRVRDQESQAIMQSMGLQPELKADDGFRVAECYPQWFTHAPKSAAKGQKPKVGVCVFEQFGEKNEKKLWWNQLFQEMKTRFPEIEVEGFSFDSRPKFEYNTLTKLLPESGWEEAKVLKPFSDFREAMAYVKQSYDAVITCRFHAAVVSQVFDIPTIAYASGEYYIAKMESVRANSNHCTVVSPETHTPSQVLDILENSLKSLSANQGDRQAV